MFIFFVVDLMVFITYVYFLYRKYCHKSLNNQLFAVQEQINPFYIDSYGENSFSSQMTFRNELES